MTDLIPIVLIILLMGLIIFLLRHFSRSQTREARTNNINFRWSRHWLSPLILTGKRQRHRGRPAERLRTNQAPVFRIFILGRANRGGGLIIRGRLSGPNAHNTQVLLADPQDQLSGLENQLITVAVLNNQLCLNGVTVVTHVIKGNRVNPKRNPNR